MSARDEAPDLPEVEDSTARAFLAELQDAFGAGEMLWATARRAFDTLRKEREWPEMSDKRLVRVLCRLGCKTYQIDLRHKRDSRLYRLARGKDRPTMFAWPERTKGAKRERRAEQVEMKLAA